MKIALGCVNKSNGLVEPGKLEILRNWKRDYTIETVLFALEKEMCTPANKGLAQPAEGSMF